MQGRRSGEIMGIAEEEEEEDGEEVTGEEGEEDIEEVEEFTPVDGKAGESAEAVQDAVVEGGEEDEVVKMPPLARTVEGS